MTTPNKRATAEDKVGGRVRISVPRGGSKLVTKETLIRVLQEFARGLKTKLTIDGGDRAVVEHDGIRIKVAPGGDVAPYSWQIKYEDSVWGMGGGAYNSTEIEFTPIDQEFTGWVYLKATYTLEVISGYVQSSEMTAVVVEMAAEVPDDEDDVAVFYVPLVEVDAGKLVTQAATRSVLTSVCDNGSGDGRAEYTIRQT